MSTDNFPPGGPKKPSLDWGLERLAFPPPNAFEVVEPQTRPRPQGLFQEMLQGDPWKLLPYAEARPDLSSVAATLTALLTGARSADDLHPEERMQLDDAAAQMLTEPPVKRKINRPFSHANRKTDAEESAPEAPPSPNAFWWL